MASTAMLPGTVGVGFISMVLTTAILGTSGVYTRISEPCRQQLCDPFERPTGPTRDLLTSLGVSVNGYAAAMTTITWALLVLYLAVGLVLVWRGPSWLAAVSAIGLVGLGLTPFVDALTARDGSSDLWSTGLSVVAQISTVALLGLFPDGRWHPAWMARVWPAFVVLMAGPVVAAAVFGARNEPWGELAEVLPFLGLIAMQVHRYFRVSDWTARQQTKWVLLGFVLLALNVVIAGVLQAAGVLDRWQLATVLVAYAAFVMFGVGFAFALLRYRLYDVSLVLRRTALYAGSLVLLLVAYLGLVAVASLSMARGSTSVLSAAAVAVMALGGGLLAAATRNWFRGRILGARGRPGGVATALAAGIAAAAQGRRDELPAANLAETIAVAIGLPYAAVVQLTGHTLAEYGEPTGALYRESVVDGTGNELGTMLLSPSNGESMNRQERRALREVLPFVILILRAQDEAEELRVARVTAATSREDERRRLRRELHDGVGPLLASQLLTLDTLRLSSERGLTPEQFLAHLESQARSAITEVRRISRDLRPPALDTGGLGQALQHEVERLQDSGLPVSLDAELEGATLPAAVEVAVLRIVQEALANVVRHADATHASVEVALSGGVLEVTVEDDGRGYSTPIPGVGTVTMRERAQELGGSLSIGPRQGTAGTQVYGRIPL